MGKKITEEQEERLQDQDNQNICCESVSSAYNIEATPTDS